MAYVSPPSKSPGDVIEASYLNTIKADLDDHEDRVVDLEAAIGSGGVTGPVSSTDNAIARFDGAGGSALQNSGITIADGASGTLAGSNSGDVTLDGTPTYLTIVGQVITRALINLTSHVTGRLPWANVVQVTAGRLLGRASASGAGNVEELTLGVGLAWNGTAIDCTVAAPSTEPGSRLVAGGEIVWISAYTFRVSAATYVITGTQYTSAEQSVSLGSADPTNDRIDVIAVDDTGTVIAIAGTPAAQPSEPDIDPATQLKLGIVFVAASSSAPTTTVETIYADNAGGPGEWNWTTSGTGFNVNSTNNPHAGTKDVEGTTVAAGAYALASKPSGTLDITTYSLLVFYIRSKVTWNNNRSLQLQFRNAGVLVGSPVTFKHNTYGFDASNITTYQQIAIPITAFAIPAGTLINQIRFMDAGGSIGFYIDDVSLQTGGSTNVTGGITQAQADARYAQRANNLSDLSSASSARTNLGAVAKASSSTDNAIARYDGTSGAAIQNGAPTVEDDGRIANVTDPSGAQDVATKAYADALALNLGKRARVRAATTANITIATALNNGDTLDGVTLATGDLVLVKDQSSAAENGIYTVGVSPARFSEFDTYNEHPGSLLAVAEGTANADTLWLCTSNAGGTLNSTAIVFTQLTVSAAITQLTGDVTAGPGSGSQAATIANDAVTNAKAANMAQSTIKGRAVSAGTGDPTDLTATQATAILDAVVGDSGSGGTKGLAPAPGAGDAAAGKFLKADGTYAVPAGTGAPVGASYVTLATDGTLTSERVLTAGSGILLTDGGANGAITVAATGGGSSSVDPDAVPASPSAYDDEFLAGSLDGKWTWNNQGSAGIAFAGGFSVLSGASAASNQLRSILQSIAAPDQGGWTITVSAAVVFGGSPMLAGVVISDGTKFEIFDWSWPSTAGDQPLRIHTTTTNAAAVTAISTFQAPMKGYLRIKRTGSNHEYYFSPDGRGYVLLATRAATTFLATSATKFGLAIWFSSTTPSGPIAALSTDYFRVTVP